MTTKVHKKNDFATTVRDLWFENFRKNRRARIEVKGVSMLPLLRSGALVTVEATSVDEIHAGDVAVFRNPGNAPLCIHRVLGTFTFNQKLLIIQKGDNTMFPRVFAEDDMLGRAVVSRTSTLLKRSKQNGRLWVMMCFIFKFYYRAASPIYTVVCSSQYKNPHQRGSFYYLALKWLYLFPSIMCATIKV